jgi:hypothetical protein
MEEWKLIEGYENYEVSSHGRVRNNKTGLILKPAYNNCGYIHVSIINTNKTTRMVHRLVALAFIPNPENKIQIDHIDNDKTNNNISNLRWVTPHENTVRRQCNINAKHIYWRENQQCYSIVYTCNRKTHATHRKTLEEAEAVLANWKTMYPHNII